MTIVNPQYFNEIVHQLRENGVTVHHVSLLATRETLLKRLKSRGDLKNSWPAQQIDRCVASLSQEMFHKHIHTDNLKPEEIIHVIARTFNLDITPDDRGPIKRKLDRLMTKLRHIRI